MFSVEVSKVLLFLEEPAEADDGPVYQQSSNDGHDHGLGLNESCVGEEYRQS